MEAPIHFEDRQAFRSWLKQSADSKGVWLLFSKTPKIKTVKAGEALEEALCFGWIDGQMKKIDEEKYQKYFAPRRKNSKWSARNKKIALKMEEQGFMTERGRAKIKEAKVNGQWDAVDKQETISEEKIKFLEAQLKENPTALKHFKNMSPSVQKTYTRAYFDAKTPAGKTRRLTWIIDRLEKNLKPM